MICNIEDIKGNIHTLDFNNLQSAFINADCIKAMKAMPDKCVGLSIVDPPYGGVTQGGYCVNNSAVLAKNKEYHNSLWGMSAPPREYFEELFRVSKNQIIWGGNYFIDNLYPSQCWVVWDKDNGDNYYADVELAWTSFDRGARKFKYKWQGMLQEDMKNKEYRVHPTQKPVRLYEWLLDKFANPGDIILDTHVGSASSLIACHNKRFKYIGFEIDEVYYNLASERLKQETAQMSIFDFIEE